MKKKKTVSNSIKQLSMDEKRATCGSNIPFGISMMRNTYRFKLQKSGKIKYYCKYSCQTAEEKKDPLEGNVI